MQLVSRCQCEQLSQAGAELPTQFANWPKSLPAPPETSTVSTSPSSSDMAVTSEYAFETSAPQVSRVPGSVGR